MNKSKLKNYAPKARREFIQAVTDRAHFYGLSKDKTESVKVDGDFAIINGQAFPKAIADQREKLEERIAASTFEQVIEEIAYTWFNRFVAIRYMELHGYLSHGYRVLSNPDPDNAMPEILEKAQHVQLQGLNKEKVLELKMDGTKDEELYRMLLIAQCNELFRWMPFLFENIRDCTELLLPDNLLHSDSLIRKLVGEIEQEDWQEVEIIGWLYQFYISEKKDQVIGKVVKSEDIPAATQLFTPNWIVKYLVQNSLGSQWLRTYPNSPLKEKMEYYIEPAEQTEEVQKQLAEITPESLNPEELTLLDPACGSGHILVETYDLLKEIYLERGYRRRDIPELIFKKNLFGLEIDDRAAQLAGFAMMMKARADDRRLFEKGIVPNIVSIQESKGLDVEDIVTAINEPLTAKDVSDSPRSMEELQDSVEVPLFVKSHPAKISLDDEEKLTVDELKALLGLFEHGKTFGSLIRIPDNLAEKVPAMAERINRAYRSDRLSAHGAAEKVLPFVQQALIMAGKYDAVVANPPYMGRKYYPTELQNFTQQEYESGKADLYGCFVERALLFCSSIGSVGMITIPNWMFLPSFESLRYSMFEKSIVSSLIHNGRGVFGSDFGSCAFVIFNWQLKDYNGSYKRLFDKLGSVSSNNTISKRFFEKSSFLASLNEFEKIPGVPVSYWISAKFRDVFCANKLLSEISPPKQGLATGDNDRFLRYWFEVVAQSIGFECASTQDFIDSGYKWAPYSKGGEYRKWYGNNEYIVDWEKDGEAIKNLYDSNGKLRSRPQNLTYYFRNAITWSLTSMLGFSARSRPEGFIFDVNGMSVFPDKEFSTYLLGLLNSQVAIVCLGVCPSNVF